MIKAMYAVFVGILLVTFIGIGIATFYPAPAQPQSAPLVPAGPNGVLTSEQQQQQVDFQKQETAYEQANNHYNRNLSMLAIGFAVVLLVIGLVFAKHLDVIADGLVLGGIFTLIYGVVRGMQSQENSFRFGVTTVSLIIAMVLGYVKFVKPAKPAKR